MHTPVGRRLPASQTSTPAANDETGRARSSMTHRQAGGHAELGMRARHRSEPDWFSVSRPPSSPTTMRRFIDERAALAVAETRHVREPPAKMRSCLIVMSDASRQSRARSSSAKSSLSFRA